MDNTPLRLNLYAERTDTIVSSAGQVSLAGSATLQCLLGFSAHPGVKIVLLSKCHAVLDHCCCNRHWYCILSYRTASLPVLPVHLSLSFLPLSSASPSLPPSISHCSRETLPLNKTSQDQGEGWEKPWPAVVMLKLGVGGFFLFSSLEIFWLKPLSMAAASQFRH